MKKTKMVQAAARMYLRVVLRWKLSLPDCFQDQSSELALSYTPTANPPCQGAQDSISMTNLDLFYHDKLFSRLHFQFDRFN